MVFRELWLQKQCCRTNMQKWKWKLESHIQITFTESVNLFARNVSLGNHTHHNAHSTKHMLCYKLLPIKLRENDAFIFSYSSILKQAENSENEKNKYLYISGFLFLRFHIDSTGNTRCVWKSKRFNSRYREKNKNNFSILNSL